MASINLSNELIKHLNISTYYKANPGGQKTVFIATIEGKKYALKIINVADERFKREVNICSRFDKLEGIPSIKRIELFENDTIILEEYIEGYDLSEVADKYIGDADKVLKLIQSVIVILKPIWKAKYVHRDLKPQNIRIRPNGSPVVLDFGIARTLDEDSITATGGQPLSWFYASPEQYAGQKKLISYRTDFFCLGIVAYKLFSNSLPFGQDRNVITDNFQKGSLLVNSGNKLIDDFCNSVFKVRPAERPRTIEILLKNIKL